MTAERLIADRLREAVRDRNGLYCICRTGPDADHTSWCPWANAVDRVYELERNCEGYHTS